jgi:multidrug resistance efflux pump
MWSQQDSKRYSRTTVTGPPVAVSSPRRSELEEREPAISMNESESAAGAIAHHEVASVIIRLSRALEQTSELLEAANELHRRVAELHAALAEPLLDLERLLVEAQRTEKREP